MTQWDIEVVYSLDKAKLLGKQGWRVISGFANPSGGTTFVMIKRILPDYTCTLLDGVKRD